MTRVLFVTWDGDAQSYLTSLFFPIFARLRGVGVDVHVLQFSFASASAIQRTRECAARFDIRYTHRRTPVRFRNALTPALIGWGALESIRYARRQRIEAFMPRSLVPAAMTLLAGRMGCDRPVIFDADGFMADERVDFAGWSRNGLPYRALRAVERRLAEEARSIVVRTRHAREILSERVADTQTDTVRRRIHVIPNLKDERVFHPASEEERLATRKTLGVPQDALLLVSAGSLAPHYHPDKQAAIVRRLLDGGDDAYWLVLTGHQHVAADAAKRHRLPGKRVIIDRVAASEVPPLLAAADVGMAIREPAFSQLAVCPIKVGEYLLCGTPVLATAGVGDVETYINERSGLLLNGLGDEEIDKSCRWISSVRSRRESLRHSARAIGLSYFAMANLADLYEPVFEPIVSA